MIRNDKEYLGVQDFESRIRKSLEGDERLAVVWLAEGITQLFVVDGETGLQNLKGMFADEGDGDLAIQLFSEVKN